MPRLRPALFTRTVDLSPLRRQLVDGALHGMAASHIQVNGVHGLSATGQSLDATSASLPARRAASSRRAPSAANAIAVAAPMPALAPVMKTIFPFSFMCSTSYVRVLLPCCDIRYSPTAQS